jgi:hypothetical protein
MIPVGRSQGFPRKSGVFANGVPFVKWRSDRTRTYRGVGTLRLLLLVLLFSYSSASIAQRKLTWVGTSGDWFTASNWDSSRVPGAVDTAVINKSTANVTLLKDTSIAELRLLLGTLSPTTGALTVTNRGSWTGGTISGAGGITNAGTLTLSGSAIKTLSNGIIINSDSGMIVHADAGSLQFSNATLENRGVYEFQGNAGFTIASGTTDSVTNSGTIWKSRGTSTSIGVALNNSNGTIQVDSGTVSIARGGNLTDGKLIVLPRATLNLVGGNYATTYTGTFTGTGGGTIQLNANTLTVGQEGATFQCEGGMFEWSSGTIAGPGVLTNAGVFTLSGPTTKTLSSGTIWNEGTINHDTTGSLRFTNGILNNSGIYDFRGDGDLSDGGGTNRVNNLGIFRKSLGPSTTIIGVPMHNNDSVDVWTGTLSLTGGGTSSGTFKVIFPAVLDFAGGVDTLNTGTTFTGTGLSRVVNGGTVNISGGVTGQRFELASGGTLSGGGNLTITETFNWTGGTMSGAGITVISAGGSLNISGSTGSKILWGAHTVDNWGTTTWSGATDINGGEGAIFNNRTGGIFNIQNSQTFSVSYSGALILNNAGVFRKSAGALTTIEAVFNNTGTGSVDVQTGTLSLTGGGKSSGTFNVTSLGVLNFAGGVDTLNTGARFTGTGFSRVVSSGTVDIDGSVTAQNFELASGGTLTGIGTFAGNVFWTGGTITGSTLTNTGTLTLSGGGAKTLSNAILINQNMIIDTSTASIRFANGTLNNSGVYDFRTDADFTNVSGTNVVNNSGTFRKTYGISTTGINVPFTNRDTVDVQSGTLTFSNYSQTSGVTIVNGGTIATSSATDTLRIYEGSLRGAGTVSANVLNNGQVEPGLPLGKLTISRSYSQTSSGMLRIEIKGKPDSLHDKLSVTGTATLGGTLDITLVDNVAANLGDTFEVMTFGALKDTFSVINKPPISGGLTFQPRYSGTSLALIVGGNATVTTTGATNVDSTSAVLNGTVNPNGLATTAWFEWGTSGTLATNSSTTTQSIGSGTSEVSVTANLTNLSPNQRYYFRVVGQNSAGTQRGSVMNFPTSAIKPAVTTSAASSVDSITATLNGSVNPNNASTTAWFEWGTSSTLATYSSTVAQSIGSGTSAVSVTANLPNLTPSQLYYFRVVGQNSAGIQRGSILNFITSAIKPTVTTSAASPVTSNTATLNGSVNPNNAPTTAWFEWGTSSTLATPTLTTAQSIGSGTSAVSVTANLPNLTPSQLYYFRVVGQNSAGTQKGALQSFKTRLPPYPPTVSLNTTLTFPSYSKVSDYAASDYKIVGLPGASNIGVGTLLSGAQGTDWQVYWDNGAASNYLVKYDGGSNFNFSVGRAFWVLKKGPWAITRTVDSAPLNPSQEVEILLHPGWNLITNPFGSPVAWSMIQSANGISESIYSYNAGFATSTEFQPYTGYYFFNASNDSVLKIPYGSLFPNSSVSDELNPVSWKVNVTLSSGNSVDRSTRFGVSRNAREELDPLDSRKPRPIGAVPIVYFKRSGWDRQYSFFASDFRPEIQQAESWEFEVQSPGHKPSQIAFSGVSQIPSDFRVYLAVEAGAKSIDLRVDSVYDFIPVTHLSKFSVIVGKEDAVRERLKSMLPKEFSLSNNYPNPFNPSTTIEVDIPFPSEVKLKVYNILGLEVKTLYSGPIEAGRYTFEWDGRNGWKAPVSSGVYFCRLTAGAGTNLMRKMIFLK